MVKILEPEEDKETLTEGKEQPTLIDDMATFANEQLFQDRGAMITFGISCFLSFVLGYFIGRWI